MESLTRSEPVANLGGFVDALSTFSGDLRHFVSFAYGIEVEDKRRAASDLINDNYRGQDAFLFSSARTVQIDRRTLEAGIRSYPIRGDNVLVAGCVPEMRLFLSVRVMDMIEGTAAGACRNLEGIEIECPVPDLTGASAFFCLQSSGLLPVLQFNHRNTHNIDQNSQAGRVG